MTNLFTRQGSELLVNTASYSYQFAPTITSLANGGFVVTWVTDDPTQDGSGSAIKAQMFNASGAKQGGEFLVNSATSSNQVAPTITGLANGGFVVTWRTDDTSQDGSGSAIKAQLFSAEGVKQGGEFLVNSAWVSDQYEPTITELANGGFVVAWSHYDPSQPGVGPQVKAQAFSASGVPQGAEIVVITAAATGYLYTPAIAGLANGGFVLTWETYEHGIGSEIKAQVFDATGLKQGSEFLVNIATAFDEYHPTITGLVNGDFVVTWYQDGGAAIRAQIFSAAGMKQGAEILVNSAWASDDYDPTITALANGGFVVTWCTDDIGQDGSNSAIKAQVFDAFGVKQGAEFLVNTASYFGQYSPTITGLDNGGFVVTWTTYDPAQDGSGHAVKAHIFQPTASFVDDVGLSVTSVAETQVAGAQFALLSASGPINATYTYALLSDSTGAFAVQGDGLVVVDNTRLDYETSRTVTLVARATDQDGLWFDKTFTLAITDASVEDRYRAGAEFLVNTASSGSQSNPTITGLANGGFVVTWETHDSAQDGSGSAIKAQVLSAAGVKQGSEFLVNSAGYDSQNQPTVTGLANGGFVVTWTTYDRAQDFSLSALKAQIFTAAGVKQGAEFLINTANYGYQSSPTIAGLANGGFVVTWTTADTTQDGSGYAIKAQVFDAAGSKRGEFLVNSAKMSHQDGPTITGLANGGFVVTWGTGDPAQDGSGSAIKAQVFDAAGVKLGSEFLVNTAASGSQSSPTITSLFNGGFVVTWQTDDTSQDGSGSAIKAQVFDAAGVKLGSEFLVNNAIVGDQGQPTITGLSNGGFVVTWTTDDPAQDGILSSIKAQVFDAAGAKQGAEFLVNTAGSGYQYIPTITALADGGFSVAWTTGDPAQDGSGYAIKARIFAPTGLNQPPMVEDAAVTGDEDTEISGTLVASDVDGDPLTYALAGAAANGTAVVNPDGSFSYSPAPEFNGSDSFTYSVGDGQGGSATGTVNLTITPVNDLPVSVDDAVSGQRDTPLTLSIAALLGNDHDADGDSLLLVGVGSASHGTVAVVGSNIVFIPATGFAGIAGFDYTIDDAAGGQDIGHVSISVLGTILLSLTQANDSYVAATDDDYIIDGRKGEDVITTAAGADIVTGGPGNDIVSTGDGNDSIRFGAGSTGFDHVDGGAGIDRLEAAATNAVIGLASLTGVEAITANGYGGVKILLTAAHDSLDLSGVALTGVTLIDAGAGNDWVIGSAGADAIAGGKGNDTLLGGGGDDVFLIGTGAGTDQFDGGANFDTIRASAANVAVSVTGSNLVGIEAISSGGFAGLRLVATSAGNLLDFSGMSLTGVSLIDAGSGNDTVTGSAGSDTILGGAGQDMMFGGDGADVFDFNKISEIGRATGDTIADWQDGLDRIDLSTIDANTTATANGDQAFAFSAAGAFSRTAGELIAQVQGGDTQVLGDVNGDGRADFDLRIVGNGFVIDAGDFVL